MIISHLIYIRMRNVSNESCRGNQNTCILCPVTFVFLENMPFMRYKVEKFGRVVQATDVSII